MVELEYKHVVKTVNEVLIDSEYEGIELDEVGPKAVDRLCFQVSKRCTNIICLADDVAKDLNNSLELTDKPKYKPMNHSNFVVFRLHLIDID